MQKPRDAITLVGTSLGLSFLPAPAYASFMPAGVADHTLVIGAVLASLAVAGLAGFFFWWWRRQKPRALLSRAQAARERQDPPKAIKLFSRTIRRLEQQTEIKEEEKGILQEAHLGLAYVYETKEQTQEASRHYVAAYEAGLALEKFPPYGLILLAQALAQAPDVSDQAVEVYLAYVALKPRPLHKQIGAVLERLGSFPEVEFTGSGVSSADLTRVVRIARKVAQVDPAQMWPHLSLGIAAALAHRFDEALPHLMQASRRAPEHPAAHYWLGQVLRHKAAPDFAGAREAFLKFLAVSKSPAERAKRAETAFFLGQAKPSGYAFRWTDPPALDAQEDAELQQAVHWLELAIAEGHTAPETYYLLAVAHFLRGQLPQATLALVHAVGADPQNFAYRFALGIVYLAAGQRQEAEREYLQALRLDPRNQETQRKLMHFYLEDNRWPEVAERCRALIDLAGPELQTVGTLVLALSQQEKFEEVVSLASMLHSFVKEQEAPPIIFLMARAHSLTRNFIDAVTWYDLTPDLHELPAAWYYRACALGQLGRTDESLEAFRTLAETDNDYQAEAHLQRGHLFCLQGRFQEALAAYQQAQKLKPQEPEILYALGVSTYQQGQTAQSLVYFSQCLEVNPRHSGSRLGLGLAREKEGDHTGARQDYQKVIELDPNNRIACERLAIMACRDGDFPLSLGYFMRLEDKALGNDQSLYHLGFALTQEKELSLALKIWSRLAARHPEDEELQHLVAYIRYLLGQQILKAGHYGEAMDLWSQYLLIFPEDMDTRRELAEILWRQALGKLNQGEQGFGEAEDLLHGAILLDGNHWKYPYFLAQVAWAAGRREDAEAALQQLVERFPDDARIRYHLGLISLLLGHRDQALAAWQAASAAPPEAHDPYAAHALLALANESVAQGDYVQAADLLAAGWKIGASRLDIERQA